MPFMSPDYVRAARRRTLAVGVVGVAAVALFGQALAMPALAASALVYYLHQLVAVVLWDVELRHPDLAFVIVVNSLVVLVVQAIVAFDALRVA